MDEPMLADELALAQASALPSTVAAAAERFGSHLVAPRPLTRQPPSKYARLAQRAAVPIGLLILWWVATSGAHWMGEQVLHSPSEVW